MTLRSERKKHANTLLEQQQIIYHEARIYSYYVEEVKYELPHSLHTLQTQQSICFIVSHQLFAMSFSRLLLSKATLLGAARPVQQQSFAAARSLSTKEVFSNGDLVNAIAAEHDISKAETRRIVASVFDSIVEACANDKKVRMNCCLESFF